MRPVQGGNLLIFRGDHKLELPEARCRLLSRPAGELEGMVFSDRAIQKIRAQETGWLYAVELRVNAGTPAPGPDAAAMAPAGDPTAQPSRQLQVCLADSPGPARTPAPQPHPELPQYYSGFCTPSGGVDGYL